MAAKVYTLNIAYDDMSQATLAKLFRYLTTQHVDWHIENGVVCIRGNEQAVKDVEQWLALQS